MAEVVKYYQASNIVVYPTTNSLSDEGKLNTEKNMAAIVTRITERNYCLTKEAFTLSVQPDTDFGFVIQIEAGEANIQGYHVITDSYIRIKPPETLTGEKIAVGFKLARDGSGNLLGDVTYNLITEYEGLWLSYFDADTAREDKDILILGYVDWDGNNFSNVMDNPEKQGRLDGKDVIVYVSDPKHPDIEFLTLQQLVDMIPDWYVSKEGDVEYGSIDFLPGRIQGDDPNNLEDPSLGNKSPGIHIQAEGDNYSVWQLLSSEKQLLGHELLGWINDLDNPRNSTLQFRYNNEDRGKLYICDPENWLHLYSNSTLHLDSKDETLINSDGPITMVVNGDNNLKAQLTKKNFTLSNPLNNKNIDFTINETDLKMGLGDANFDYNNNTDRLTITGLERTVFEDRVEFKKNVTMDGTLYFGGDSSDTYINQNTWHLHTSGNNQTFDEKGQLLKQVSGGSEPRTRWENTTGSEYTEVTPGDIYVKGKNAGMTLENDKGQKRRLYVDDNGRLHVDGDLYLEGDLVLPAGSKVWNAVYN